jgi:cytochrome P450
MTLVTELDLPAFDYTAPDFSADRYHGQLAQVRAQGWLARSPLAYLVLDREAGEFFRRLRALVGPAFTPRAADRWRPVMRDLLAAEDDGERLSPAECVNLVVNVLAGAIDTTQSQLGHALRLFAAHPGQWEALAADPALVPRAVQEVLRFEPITPFTARICTADLEHRGVTFPAGTIVAICSERANREEPGGEDFDITARRDGRLLTFGAGAHYCLGANLARAELEEALAFLAPRMPGLAAGGPARLGGVEGIYGIDELPLSWDDELAAAGPPG